MAMRLWILGSGTLLPHAHRGAPAHWLEAGEATVLLDCGAGVVRTLAALERPWEEITHLLLSHFHTDHVGGLAPFLFALKHGRSRERSRPLRILGPPGTRELFRRLAEAYGPYILDPGFPLEFHEIPGGGDWMDPHVDLHVATRPTRHTEESLAFRIRVPEGTVGYTGDTGPDPGLGVFLRDADVLLAECSVPDTEVSETHLTPSSLAGLASEAGEPLLVSLHTYPPLEPEEVPELVRLAGYGGRVLSGWDGLCLRWLDGRVAAE